MTVTFVDTSALFILLDRDDANHTEASAWFTTAAGERESLVTHNYVVVESAALVDRRLGPPAIRALVQDFLPLLSIEFVLGPLHWRATSAYLATIGRRTSLVDLVSFEFMRERGLRRAFAFDRDFTTQGFVTVP